MAEVSAPSGGRVNFGSFSASAPCGRPGGASPGRPGTGDRRKKTGRRGHTDNKLSRDNKSRSLAPPEDPRVSGLPSWLLLVIFLASAGVIWVSGVKLSDTTDVLAERLH